MPKVFTKPAPLGLSITHGGETLPFAIDFNDWCDAEAHLNKSLGEVLQDLSTAPSGSTIRYLVALGLSNGDHVYAEKEAGVIVGEIGLTVAADLVARSVVRFVSPAAPAA